MRSELERLGFSNRGVRYTDEQLVRLLRERGYDVSEKPAPKIEQGFER